MDPEALMPVMPVENALRAGMPIYTEKREAALREYSEKREGKDFWKPDITLRIEDDMKTGKWQTIIETGRETGRDKEKEDQWYTSYSSFFDKYMRLPDNIPINEFKEWFNQSWGQYTPSKKLFEKEVINNFPRFAILVSKHEKIRDLIEKFKAKYPDDFLSLKKSYIFDMIFNNDIKEENDKLRSAYYNIVSKTVGPDEGFRSAPITDEQRDRINKTFFITHVYEIRKQSGGKSKKTRRSRRKSKTTHRIRRSRK